MFSRIAGAHSAEQSGIIIPGDKVWKTDASLLAGGLAKLGSAKNMSKKPFLLKNERITNVF